MIAKNISIVGISKHLQALDNLDLCNSVDIDNARLLFSLFIGWIMNKVMETKDERFIRQVRAFVTDCVLNEYKDTWKIWDFYFSEYEYRDNTN